MFKFLKYFSKNNPWFDSIEKKLNYTFKKKQLLKIALTHKSVKSEANQNYERFELIGDSVVNLVITEWLTIKYPNAKEGELTTKRASIVSTFFLSKISQLLNLSQNLIISKGVDINNTVVSKNINADLYESIVGAIYIDSDFYSAKKFILKTLIKNYDLLDKNINYKGILIEHCHKTYNKPPIFKIIETNGPDHDKTFKVRVTVNNIMKFEGNGKSIKDAEQKSAHNAINDLNLN